MSLQFTDKNNFLIRLKKRKLEDVKTIKFIEKFLIEKRGYIYKKPSKLSPVILLVSGGLDSITCWGILMREFKLKVFPLTLDKGEKRRRKEESSITYFSDYYHKKFPDLYVKPFHLSTNLKEISIPIEKAEKILHGKVMLDNMNPDGSLKLNLSLGSFSLTPFYAMLYSRYLEFTKNIKIRDILCAVTKGDDVISQTFTSLRMTMMAICVFTGEYDWQFSSAIFEKERELFYSKGDLVKWGERYGLKLEKTWSCYRNEKYQCGTCIACIVRKKAFMEASIVDRTSYQNEVSNTIKIVNNKINSKIQYVKNKILTSY